MKGDCRLGRTWEAALSGEVEVQEQAKGGLGQVGGLTEEGDTGCGGRQGLIPTVAAPGDAVWPWWSHITSLSLSNLHCQVGIPSLPARLAGLWSCDTERGGSDPVWLTKKRGNSFHAALWKLLWSHQATRRPKEAPGRVLSSEKQREAPGLPATLPPLFLRHHLWPQPSQALLYCRHLGAWGDGKMRLEAMGLAADFFRSTVASPVTELACARTLTFQSPSLRHSWPLWPLPPHSPWPPEPSSKLWKEHWTESPELDSGSEAAVH